jgi:hypothetical protein
MGGVTGRPLTQGRSGIDPQQTSEQLPPHLSECLLSSDGRAPWNDRDGRVLAVGGPRDGRLFHAMSRIGLASCFWRNSCSRLIRAGMGSSSLAPTGR